MVNLHVTIISLNAHSFIPPRFIPYLEKADLIMAEWGPADNEYHSQLEEFEKKGKIIIKALGTARGRRILDDITREFPEEIDGTEFYQMEKSKIEKFIKNLPEAGNVVVLIGKILLPRLKKELIDLGINYEVQKEFDYSSEILKKLQAGLLNF